MIKEIIISTMLNFIGKNYGSQEMEDPCYDIESMAIEIEKVLMEKNKLRESEIKETHEL